MYSKVSNIRTKASWYYIDANKRADLADKALLISFGMGQESKLCWLDWKDENTVNVLCEMEKECNRVCWKGSCSEGCALKVLGWKLEKSAVGHNGKK